MRAGVLARDEDARRPGPPLRATLLVPAVEQVGVAGGDVRGVNGRAVVAKLLEVEDALPPGVDQGPYPDREGVSRRMTPSRMTAPRMATNRLPRKP